MRRRLSQVSSTKVPESHGTVSDMSLYLNQEFSLWGLTLLLILAACVYAIGLMLLTRHLYGVDRLSLNNEVAGFKFAVVGVFYAVLLAFVVVAVWEGFRDTEGTVRNEAKAAVDLHRVASVLPGPASADIRRDVITYVKDVHDVEWPKMAVGESSDVVAQDLGQLTKTVFAFNPGTTQEMALYQNALRLLAQLTDNRNERLDSADGSVPTVLWFVLIAGGLITLGYPAFLRLDESGGAGAHDGVAGRTRRDRALARHCLRPSLHRRRAGLGRPVRTRFGRNAGGLVFAVKHRPCGIAASPQDVDRIVHRGTAPGRFAPVPRLWRDTWTRRNRSKRPWPKPSARRMRSRAPSTSR